MSRHKPASGYSRTDRIGDEIQKELASLIRDRVKDPRLPGMVSVNRVKVARDLSYADVYVSSLDVLMQGDAEKAIAATEEILEHASGFLRTELGRLIQLRTMPKLRFHYDRTAEEGSRMDRLIRDALNGGDEE